MAHIIRQTTVTRDGMHNAFTDLQYWQGNYWVAYRKGAGHVSMDGEAVVAVSADRKRFREVAHLKMPGDCRDPKLLPLDETRMACYFPSWTTGIRAKQLQHYITFSTNGYDWDTPRPILETGRWLWRVRPHNGRYYGLVQTITGGDADKGEPKLELDLVVSDDLLHWEEVARIGEGCGLCESDIQFRPDGEAWVIARTVLQNSETGSYFASAKPPYTDWQATPMHPVVHAPVVLEHAGQLYVAGRYVPGHEGETTFPFPRHHPFGPQHEGWSTAVWRMERATLEKVLCIPATGDCSYPGLIEDPEGRVCLSYYSQHAYHMGIADVPAGVAQERYCNQAADIYFTELELTDESVG